MENSQQSPKSFEQGLLERSRLAWDKHRVVTHWLEKVEPHSKASGGHGHTSVINVADSASPDPPKVSPQDRALDTKGNTAGSS
ncbi:hypothetical protein EMPG_16826 [Blastomyces silverae]|uniref:Uncharacterized protein n=1 Tax=Blastomyces silverae TaxID=2060906 RepID=A0A0H1B9K7_9EURO|nr:hypothetical protein EMPG_16826 [Blastomyces silverae]